MEALPLNADFKQENESSNIIKEKEMKLKGNDEQLYYINIKLFENSIFIEAFNEKDITKSKYLINYTYQDFTKLNSFFNQYSKIEEIFELLEDMKSDEFKINKNNNEYIEFYLLIELRRKKIEIPIKLMISNNDINNVVQNICKIIENLKDKEISDLRNKNVNLEKQILDLNKKFKKLENKVLENEKLIEDYKQKINKENNKIDELQNIINKEKERINILEQKSKEDKNKIDNLEKNINKDEKIINDLNIKIQENNNKNEIIKEILDCDNYINSEFYDSFKYIKNNDIKLETVIINKVELAQINNGIRRQKKANIKKMNLLYRSTRDGGEVKDYHSKCDGHKNLLTLVKTEDGKKFGGFSSLELKISGGSQKDDTAFIFSLDKKQNYYIKKGKDAVYFKDRGPIFGKTYGIYSEFTINLGSKNCFKEESCCDDTGLSCCYDYEEGSKYILAGKYKFKVLDYEVFELEFIAL